MRHSPAGSGRSARSRRTFSFIALCDVLRQRAEATRTHRARGSSFNAVVVAYSTEHENVPWRQPIEHLAVMEREPKLAVRPRMMRSRLVKNHARPRDILRERSVLEANWEMGGWIPTPPPSVSPLSSTSGGKKSTYRIGMMIWPGELP